MKNVFLLLVAVALIYFVSTGYKSNRNVTVVKPVPAPKHEKFIPYLDVYDQLQLSQTGLQKSVFEYALRGWQRVSPDKSTLTIVDLSQPSTHKRMYVVDLIKKKLLFNTYVAHGQNSGDLVAERFSNKQSSFQSSLGFYQTLNTYMGKHGLSLQLKGLEKGFNDNVYNRNIVLHGADYVCEDFIRKTGRLGRSQGCPAVPYADSKGIIQAVKGGSCLFVYSPNTDYLAKSAYLAEQTEIASLQSSVGGNPRF
ncbi:murein L,D-transpeptidase catalytic domain family protein [Spirosoma validum]|uniref:Murein L,D-transpeptidase catalytic domain family protein n=1 Tax=Spirosoma validum TaxID=2771355 RepID=A0A927B5L4_9BACT|nr:murein L,D-transpeptidase catalytic domain family protein [Spirosoma validum]MBD2755622.1 murein L,D-transpeptidase catalytic domain family protein [Spirosoma validum]